MREHDLSVLGEVYVGFNCVGACFLDCCAERWHCVFRIPGFEAAVGDALGELGPVLLYPCRGPCRCFD